MGNDYEFGATAKDLVEFGSRASNEKISGALTRIESIEAKIAKIDETLLATEGRLSAMETDLANLKSNVDRVLEQVTTLNAKHSEQEGFLNGIVMASKASAWVIGLLYSAMGGILGFLLTKIFL